MFRFFLLLVLAAQWVNAQAQDITLAADPWCPYNCTPNSSYEGFLVETVREALAPFKINVNYVNMPYTRAVKNAEMGKIDGVLGASREESNILAYPEHHVGHSLNAAVIRQGTTWRLKGLDSLKGKRLVGIKGYSYGEEIDKLLAQLPEKAMTRFYGNNALELGIQFIAVGRGDIFFEDYNVAMEKIKQLGLNQQLDVIDNLSDPIPIYIAFSPQSDKAFDLVSKFEKGLQKLKETGRLNQIYEKYSYTVSIKNAQKQKTATMAADQTWKPFNSPDLPEEGILVALSRAALQASGYHLNTRYMTWSRALNATLMGKYDFVCGIYRSPEREKQYLFSKPLININAALISRKNTIADISWQALESYKIATVVDNVISESFDRHKDTLNIQEVRNSDLQAKLLAAGRIDLAAVSSIRVFFHILRENGLNPEDFHVHLPYLKVQPVHIAVSKTSPHAQQLINTFNTGLKAIKKSGEFDTILKRLLPAG